MIAGQKVTLRALERSHLDRTRSWANDPELARLLDRFRPISDVEHEQWFASLERKDTCLYFAIETNDGPARHVGNVWLWDIDPRHRKAEVRIVIGDREVAGQGVGTEAIDLACTYGFQRLNLHRLYACVLEINPRARRAFEKAGFLLEGTLRQDRWVDDRYVDVFVLGRMR
jgi:diamine N-acetyltransferase